MGKQPLSLTGEKHNIFVWRSTKEPEIKQEDDATNDINQNGNTKDNNRDDEDNNNKNRDTNKNKDLAPDRNDNNTNKHTQQQQTHDTSGNKHKQQKQHHSNKKNADSNNTNSNIPHSTNNKYTRRCYTHRKPTPHRPLIEPILKTDNKRYSVYPIKDAKTWAQYKQAEASFWTVVEVDLRGDKEDWMRLKEPKKQFITMVLAFFVTSDGIISKNLCAQFASEVQQPEARCFYGMQIAIENIHNEMYGLLINTYIQDKWKKQQLFNAITNTPCIKSKADWALQWCNQWKAPFAQRVIAFAAVEGIFFSSSFTAIFWLKKRGLMPGLCTANTLISHDKGMHCKFACHIHSKMARPASPAAITKII
ncbi:hypothetical protein ACA910_021843 [Epithemia clementina (nom. ined.)]